MNKDILKAEFIGIMLGDGYLNIKNNELKISLDKIKEVEYSKQVIKLINNIFDIKVKAYPRKCDGTLDIRSRNRKLIKEVSELGLKQSPKMCNAIIPKNFMNKKYYPHLVRGYFDTDGCITATNNNGIRYPRVEMKICNSPMQKQYTKILKELGINFGAYKIDNNAIRVQANGFKELKKWMKIIGSRNKKNIDKAITFLKY